MIRTIWLIVLLRSTIFLLIFCLLYLLITGRGVLKSQIIDWSSSYSFINCCLMCFDALFSGTYKLRPFMSPWTTDCFFNMQHPPWSLIIYLVPKLVSSAIIAIPAFFRLVWVWYIFCHSFTFKLSGFFIFKNGFFEIMYCLIDYDNQTFNWHIETIHS